MTDSEIMIVDEGSLQDRIYNVRGTLVMLDFDLAEIYGYSVSAFNQQVKRNIDRFPNDFMFQLTKLEFENLMSQNVISSWGGRRKLPYAFTEQGIYMLMTVLKGSSAIEQSITLIRLFKSIEDREAVTDPWTLAHCQGGLFCENVCLRKDAANDSLKDCAASLSIE